jgi:hypothetical protein
VLNQRNRPVELHIGRRVVRIPPLATASVPQADESDSAQLHELVRQRVVTILGEAPAPRRRRAPAASKAAKTPARKAKAARKTR